MFAVFCGEDYYPGGGWHDHQGTCPTFVDAVKLLLSKSFDWYHIVDLAEGEIVEEGRKP